MIKLNIGCGRTKLNGFVNVDINKTVNPDVLSDGLSYIKSLDDNSVGCIIMTHVLEHMTWGAIQEVIEEMYRVCPNGVTIHIQVPHCTSIHAANPQHRCAFSTTFWDFWTMDCATGEKYGQARFVMHSCKLHVRAYRGYWIDLVFNSFGRSWQMICERFWPFRFDEIEWGLEVRKQD